MAGNGGISTRFSVRVKYNGASESNEATLDFTYDNYQLTLDDVSGMPTVASDNVPDEFIEQARQVVEENLRQTELEFWNRIEATFKRYGITLLGP
jgi:hypothetical protein